jgi:O-antigen/teichoic acid export membrane protein
LLLLTTAQGAGLSGPLVLVAARKCAEERRAMVGAVRDSQRQGLQWLTLAVLALVLGGYLLRLLGLASALFLVCAWLSGWAALRREYVRNVLLLYSRPYSLLGADVAYVAVLFLGVVAASFSKSSAAFWATAALWVAGLVGAACADRMIASSPGWATGDARPAFREMRQLGFWSSVGALTYWIFSQSFNYLLASRLDLTAVADVNATRLLLMPTMVLTIGVQSLLTPTAALWYAEAGFTALMRRLLVFILGMGALDLAYLAVTWLSRDWIMGTVLHKQIAARDELLVLWGLVAMIGLVRDVLQCALFALGRQKSLAGQIAVSAAVALLVMWFGMYWWGAPAVLIGQIAGELINLLGIGLLLRRAYPQPEATTTLPYRT